MKFRLMTGNVVETGKFVERVGGHFREVHLSVYSCWCDVEFLTNIRNHVAHLVFQGKCCTDDSFGNIVYAITLYPGHGIAYGGTVS